MHMNKLLEKIACLEFANDQLSTELSYVDRLLRAIGFSDGLKTVKSAAQELFEQEKWLQTEREQGGQESNQE